MNRPLTPDAVNALLERPMQVRTYPTLDSTNNEAKRLALAGLGEPCLLIADSQTAGKGRLGRSFYSPAESGLYMSVLLHPNAPAAEWLPITSAAAVAVCLAIESLTSLKPRIKWVNDIYIGDRKVCGILTEAISEPSSGLMKSVIVGIGVNLSTAAFPDELVGRASSLYPDGHSPIDRATLAAAITNELCVLADKLSDTDWLECYRARAYLDGKAIVYYENGEPHEGIAVGIDAHGGLIVEDAAGIRRTLTSGEVTVRVK